MRLVRKLFFAAVIVGLVAMFAGVASATPLEIWVDSDGSAYLYNTTSAPISFDGYTITSEPNRLDPAGWKSIYDYVAGGQITDVTDVISGLGPGALSFGEANPGFFYDSPDSRRVASESHGVISRLLISEADAQTARSAVGSGHRQSCTIPMSH